MINSSISRGQKQRIKNKIARLTGQEKTKVEKEGEQKLTAKEKIENLLKKREQKKEQKKPVIGEDDKKIIKQIKNKKREQRRIRSKEADGFDNILDSYKRKKFTE